MKNQAPRMGRSYRPWLAATAALMVSCNGFAATDSWACGGLSNHYGPFDYRTDRGETLDVVNRAHFTTKIEALVRGHTTSIGGDLSYTLRAFPNHHRALLTMMRYGQKLKTRQPKDAEFSVECYFQRALRFRPDDAVARMMYANFLTLNARGADARVQLEQVTHLAGDNAFTHYNLGLAYLDLMDYEKALQQAHKAIALGLGQSALRDRLVAAGKWREPEALVTPLPLIPTSE
ncbi:MAG: ABC transporter permease [Rhodoferax sp.]|uniref:tetratricopeptide repeat protein n=1 Tax=Rhodoferax sp. TaxID=50421 RepID=UPI0013FF5B98|nr:tetratricopeptide repeat protein [Rhodoferax sp.]NDP38246.1 ABC transporter permease [Rhodoferax sp.]